VLPRISWFRTVGLRCFVSCQSAAYGSPEVWVVALRGLPKVSQYPSLVLRACIMQWFPRCPGGMCRSEIATPI
jgi:hypothetical protein